MIDVIVVGAGPSGMTVALNLLRAGRKVLIFEKENYGGQIATSPRVENIPGTKEINGLEFSEKLFDQIMDWGVDFELEDVQKIEKVNNHFVVTTNYHSYESKAVVIANGVKHREFGLPKEHDFVGKGISYCATCDGPFYKGKDVYLIGDANTALQYALLLSSYCPNVYMFTLFDRYFADKVLIDRLVDTKNIHVTMNMNLIEFLGDNELTGLKFENTKTKEVTNYPTDNVFICIGQVSQNEAFKGLVDMDEKGFIITDDKMNTSVEGIFAIGDTRKKDVRQVSTAVGDASVASFFVDKYLTLNNHEG